MGRLIEYISSNYLDILIQIRSHLLISLLAVLIACAIGIPLGYLASKSDRAEKIISTPFHLLRVIPSLAILVVLIPIIGVGELPAIIALTILALPPVIVNTIVGFRTVPDFLKESAAGIGMNDNEIIRQICIPLAMPMILAGIRTGMIEAIASATLAAKIGAGGLGEIIFTGLGLNRMDLVALGGILVAILSLGCSLLFDRIGRVVVREGIR
ncbi:MAG: ABC transporter permease [Eubacteriales bacterium]|nr:ABC transporter permease [Eubacteriales bacterium]